MKKKKNVDRSRTLPDVSPHETQPDERILCPIVRYASMFALFLWLLTVANEIHSKKYMKFFFFLFEETILFSLLTVQITT